MGTNAEGKASTGERKQLASELGQVVMRNVALELAYKMKERGITSGPTASMLVDYLDAHTPTMLLSAISDALEEVFTARGIK